MISGQVDRLRTAAQTYRRLGNHTAEGMFLEAADTICELQTDNAKLRELVRELLTGYECGYGELCKGCTWDGLGDSKTFSCLPRVQARKLGVEVDDG